MDHKVNIVNRHLKFQEVSLVEPSKSYYLHIAAEIDHSPFRFFLSASSEKKELIEQAKKWCKQLENENGVISAVVFKASIIPPGKGKYLQERLDKVQIYMLSFCYK